jgi:Circadian oscillating protein COP23
MDIKKWLGIGAAVAATTPIAISLACTVLSNNIVNVNSGNSRTNVPMSPESPANTVAPSSYAACVQDNIREYTVVSKTGAKAKKLIKVVTGQKIWGDPYTESTRCEQIANQYTKAKQKGATGWSVTMKNRLPIICAATSQSCLLDEKGTPFQLATFMPDVNAKELLEKLKKQANPNYQGSDPTVISTGSNFYFFPE